jgi:hypothetical protein
VPSSTVCLSFDFDAMSVWFGYDRTTHVEGGVLTVCMHPQVIGRGDRVAMLDASVDRAEELGARFEPLGDVASRLA